MINTISTTNTTNTATFGLIDGINFAAYLIKKAQERGHIINVTKVQKWLYICYGLFLADYDTQLLHDRPKAWDYGPVFPKVHSCQVNGKMDGLVANANLDLVLPEIRQKCDDIINAVLLHFGDWMATELVDWTHTPGMAWDKTIKESGKYSTIDNFDIYKDFKRYV